MDFDDTDDTTTDGEDIDSDSDDAALENDLTAELPDPGAEELTGILSDLTAETEPALLPAVTEESDWKDDILELDPELTRDMLDCLDKPPNERDWQEVEAADLLRHPEYATQKSFLTDEETGLAVRDEKGELVECPRGTRGAQRPDGFLKDEAGEHFRELKDYHDLNSLKHNIKEQTESRRAAFGDEVDLTYVVAPNFTVEEAMKLQTYVEDKLGVELEWQLK